MIGCDKSSITLIHRISITGCLLCFTRKKNNRQKDKKNIFHVKKNLVRIAGFEPDVRRFRGAHDFHAVLDSIRNCFTNIVKLFELPIKI